MLYIFAWKPAFLQDSCQLFYGPGWLPCANVISKCMLWVRGLVALWVLRHFLSLISSRWRYITYCRRLAGALSLPTSDVCVRSFLCLFSSVQSCPTLCNPLNCSTPGFSIHHQLPELTQTHVSEAIQPSHPLSSLSPPTFNLCQHQGLFHGVRSSHQMARVLEFQL